MISTLPMLVYLVVFGTIYMVIAFRIGLIDSKTKQDRLNEFINALMWYTGAVFYPFAYSPTIDPVIYDYFNWFTNFAMIGVFLVIAFIVGRQKLLVKRDPSLKEKRQYDKFAAGFSHDYTFKMDVIRKMFHGFIPAFVLAAYFLGNLLVSIWGITFTSGHDLGIFFIINCGFGGLFLFAAADIIRLSWYFKDRGCSIFHLLPTTVLDILTKRMHFKELTTFVPTVLILLSFIPFLPAPFSVFSSVALIAAISDAMASFAGKYYDQNHSGSLVFPGPRYKFFRNKNAMGYLSGAISTFFIVFLMLFIFPVTGIIFWEAVLISIIISFTFLLIDVTSPPINDNMLNPVASGVVMLILLGFLA